MSKRRVQKPARKANKQSQETAAAVEKLREPFRAAEPEKPPKLRPGNRCHVTLVKRDNLISLNVGPSAIPGRYELRSHEIKDGVRTKARPEGYATFELAQARVDNFAKQAEKAGWAVSKRIQQNAVTVDAFLE